MIPATAEFDPIDREREDELFRRRDRGDIAARDEMIARNVPLAKLKSAPTRRRYPSHADDILSAAYAGLVAAANAFRPGGPARFSTHAARLIVRACRDWVHEEFHAIRIPKEYYQSRYLEDPGRADESRAARRVFDAHGMPRGHVEDLLASVGSFSDLQRRDEMRFVRQAVGKLDRLTSLVIRRRFQVDWDQAESHWAIGRAMKMPRSLVVEVERRGLEILREKLAFIDLH